MNAVKKQRIQRYGLILSWLLIAFGHPSYFDPLCFLSSSLAYGLFWVTQFGKKPKKVFKAAFLWFFFVGLLRLPPND